MTEADLPAVERLEQQLFAAPWSIKQLAASLRDSGADGRYWMWLAEQQGAGSDALANPSPASGYLIASHGGGVADLLSVGVDSSQQRRGIAHQLLQQLFDQLSCAGVEELFLEVRRSNQAAIALYRRCGLVSVGLRKNYYPTDSGREDAIVMRYLVSADS